ncbi:MAG: nicotinate-nucleotide adenylyltransferase [Calditrichia bacterium]
MKKQKLGILGGTFNPVHFGHLIIAEYLREELGLTEVRFLPAKIHALKDNREIAPAKARLEMLQLATAGNPHFTVDDRELEREGTSYTVDTLEEMWHEYDRETTEIYFIIGQDNLATLNQWKAPEKIAQLCRLVVACRPGYQRMELDVPWWRELLWVKTPQIEISSTDIRKRIREGRSLRYLLPESVIAYIYNNFPYGGA